MALINCNFHSHVLGMATSLKAIVPEPPAVNDSTAPAPRRRFACLYLLHGLSDDETIWQRRTSIERYVEGMPLVVIMPNAHRSFYIDMHDGYRYGTFIADELPRVVEALFPVSERREDRFIAGLSMGGYGAFRLALLHPDRYAAAASLSGALDIVRIVKERELMSEELRRVFGETSAAEGSNNDLFALAAAAAGSGLVPRMFQWCGTEDWLLDHNRRFRSHAKVLGLDVAYSESAGGHEWSCWDAQIQRVLDWLEVE